MDWCWSRVVGALDGCSILKCLVNNWGWVFDGLVDHWGLIFYGLVDDWGSCIGNSVHWSRMVDMTMSWSSIMMLVMFGLAVVDVAHGWNRCVRSNLSHSANGIAVVMIITTGVGGMPGSIDEASAGEGQDSGKDSYKLRNPEGKKISKKLNFCSIVSDNPKRFCVVYSLRKHTLNAMIVDWKCLNDVHSLNDTVFTELNIFIYEIGGFDAQVRGISTTTFNFSGPFTSEIYHRHTKKKTANSQAIIYTAKQQL